MFKLRQAAETCSNPTVAAVALASGRNGSRRQLTAGCAAMFFSVGRRRSRTCFARRDAATWSSQKWDSIHHSPATAPARFLFGSCFSDFSVAMNSASSTSAKAQYPYKAHLATGSVEVAEIYCFP